MIDKDNDIEKLFGLASEYIDNILKDEDFQTELKGLYGNEEIQFINKNISYIFYDKNEFYNNSYQIKLDIECKNKNIGYYVLLIDNSENFIDEFLVLD